MFRLRRVVGGSMLPTLKPNQIIVVAGRSAPLHVGQVVVIQRGNREIVKRVRAIDPTKGVYIVGDNASQSTDSRTFGWCDLDEIRGRVIWPRTKPI